MPRATTTPASTAKRTPYARQTKAEPDATPSPPPSPDPADPDTPAPRKSGRGRKPGSASTPWTNDEYLELFTHVVEQARKLGRATLFDGAVRGRTRNQSYLTWKQTIEPCCRLALASKATKEGRAGKSTGNGKTKTKAEAEAAEHDSDDEDQMVIKDE